jgi:hypothetical protein
MPTTLRAVPSMRAARISFTVGSRRARIQLSSARLQRDFIGSFRTCLLILDFVAGDVGFDKHLAQIVQLLANYEPLCLTPATSPSWLPHRLTARTSRPTRPVDPAQKDTPLVARLDLSRQDAVLVDVPIADPHPDRRRHALVAAGSLGARSMPDSQALDL